MGKLRFLQARLKQILEGSIGFRFFKQNINLLSNREEDEKTIREVSTLLNEGRSKVIQVYSPPSPLNLIISWKIWRSHFFPKVQNRLNFF